MNCRLEGAITAVRDAIAAAASLPAETVDVDDDLLDDLHLGQLELESLSLILEEIFSVAVPDSVWKSPLHRTAAALAEFLIRRSDEAAWTEARQKRRIA